jgi:hypothetical protein
MPLLVRDERAFFPNEQWRLRTRVCIIDLRPTYAGVTNPDS